MNNTNDLYTKFHDRCKELTDDIWCPYPSNAFMEAVMLADDKIAKELIEERRCYLFPHFLCGEPMVEAIYNVLKKN